MYNVTLTVCNLFIVDRLVRHQHNHETTAKYDNNQYHIRHKEINYFKKLNKKLSMIICNKNLIITKYTQYSKPPCWIVNLFNWIWKYKNLFALRLIWPLSIYSMTHCVRLLVHNDPEEIELRNFLICFQFFNKYSSKYF